MAIVLRVRLTSLNCENEYLVLALGEKIAVKAVIGSIFWAFRRLKKPMSWKMSARGYALHSVCHQLFQAALSGRDLRIESRSFGFG